MSRKGTGVEPEFAEGTVRALEDLGVPVDALREAGYRITVHWGGALGISERDAFAFSMRQQRLAEQHVAQQYQVMVAQQAWPRLRSEVHREAHAAAMRGRRGTAEDRERARQAVLKADTMFLRDHPPEEIGMPSSLRDLGEPRFHGEPAEV